MKTALLLLCAFALAIVPMSAPSVDAHEVCVDNLTGSGPCACPPNNPEGIHVHIKTDGSLPCFDLNP